ncbi:MAG: hypothetical protein ACKO3C_07560 [Betaproteobacteria bacterium]
MKVHPCVFNAAPRVKMQAYLRALIEREGMAITRLFKRGNSQAVCIPAELAFSRWDIDPVTRSVIA